MFYVHLVSLALRLMLLMFFALSSLASLSYFLNGEKTATNSMHQAVFCLQSLFFLAFSFAVTVIGSCLVSYLTKTIETVIKKK